MINIININICFTVMNGLLRMIDISGYLSNNTAVYDCQSSPSVMLSPSMTKYVTVLSGLILMLTSSLNSNKKKHIQKILRQPVIVHWSKIQ